LGTALGKRKRKQASLWVESSHLRALCLREVNLWEGRIQEKQAHKRLAENGGDFWNGLNARGVAIAHERRPFGPPTTISAVRSNGRLADRAGAV